MENDAEFERLMMEGIIKPGNQHLWHAFLAAVRQAKALPDSEDLPEYNTVAEPLWAVDLDRQTPTRDAERFGWELLNEHDDTEKSPAVRKWAAKYVDRNFNSSTTGDKNHFCLRVKEYNLPVNDDTSLLMTRYNRDD